MLYKTMGTQMLSAAYSLSALPPHPLTPLPLLLGVGDGWGLSLRPNFQKGGYLTGSQFLEGACWENGGYFFQEAGKWGEGRGSSFFMRSKSKTELFNDKKGLQTKIFFFVITKNLNWEILTKNLISFKRWDWDKHEKFEYYEGLLKN